MTGNRPAHTAPRPAAVLLRLTAFVVAAVSLIVIPVAIAAAAAGHVPTGNALMIAGVLAALTLATVALARGVDPLRN